MKKLPVVGYEGQYEVTNTGEVFSVERIVLGTDGIRYPFRPAHKAKKANVVSTYFTVMLYKNNEGKTEYIHRLVAQAFIPNPGNKPEVNHLDGDKQNNAASNLEWVTSSENSLHAVQTGLRKYTNRLTADEFLECLQSVISGESYSALAERVPYKVPYLSTKLRRVARENGLEDLLDESLQEQRAKRARVNGNYHHRKNK